MCLVKSQKLKNLESTYNVKFKRWVSRSTSRPLTVLPLTSPAAAAAKSCLTLCDPIDGSLQGSPIPRILQARVLEWVAISFSNSWKWKLKVKSLNCVWLIVTPRTAAYQAPPSMGFYRQEYWSGVPLPSLLTSLKHRLFFKTLKPTVILNITSPIFATGAKTQTDYQIPGHLKKGWPAEPNNFKTMKLWQITLWVIEVILRQPELTMVTQGQLWTISSPDMENTHLMNRDIF